MRTIIVTDDDLLISFRLLCCGVSPGPTVAFPLRILDTATANLCPFFSCVFKCSACDIPSSNVVNAGSSTRQTLAFRPREPEPNQFDDRLYAHCGWHDAGLQQVVYDTGMRR